VDSRETALLRRVRTTIADAATPTCELSLDGWPLLLVDRDLDTVAVNDLRSAELFAHLVALPHCPGHMAVRVGVVGDELFVLLGKAAAVFVVQDTGRATHAEVRVVDSATGRLLFDRAVRYRQVPSVETLRAWPMCLDARG
jgi:hypothetical protein